MSSFLNIGENIFVSIASYRDSKCYDTIKSLYNNSDYPDNIYCGIFTQIDENEKCEHCYDSSFQYNTNIRRMTISYKEAKGPLWARIKIIKQLYHGEKYYLMIDAHTQFTKGWDTKYKNYINFLISKKSIHKPILTGYPADVKTINDKNSNTKTFHLCNIKSGEKYPEMFHGALSKDGGYYYKGYLMSGCCSFTLGNFLQDINLNILQSIEKLENIFHGEEFLFSLIGFVNGWDIYSTPFNLIYHEYKSSDDKVKDNTDWYKYTNINTKLKDESYKNLEKLLTTNILDNVRKVSELYDILKFNTSNNSFIDNNYYCVNPEIIKYEN